MQSFLCDFFFGVATTIKGMDVNTFEFMGGGVWCGALQWIGVPDDCKRPIFLGGVKGVVFPTHSSSPVRHYCRV